MIKINYLGGYDRDYANMFAFAVFQTDPTGRYSKKLFFSIIFIQEFSLISQPVLGKWQKIDRSIRLNNPENPVKKRLFDKIIKTFPIKNDTLKTEEDN